MSESMPPSGNVGPGSGSHTPGVAGSGSPDRVPSGGNVPQDDKTIAVLTHLSGIIHLIIMPLIVWILKKDTSPYLNDQAKEALNFQITIAIYHAVVGVFAVVTTCVHMGLGFLLFPLIYVFQLVASILAAIAANKGEYHRYPMCFRFVK